MYRIVPFNRADQVLYDKSVMSVYEGICFGSNVILKDPFVSQKTKPKDVKSKSIVLVPGAFYKEYPEHDARGSRLIEAAKQLEIQSYQINLPSFCSPQIGAISIANWFEKNLEKKILLISLSKGSADVACFLSDTKYQKYNNQIEAWISISGVFCGTPLVNRIINHPIKRITIRALLAYYGYRFSDLKELAWNEDKLPVWNSILEVDFPIIHIQSFPLFSQLTSKLAQKSVNRLRNFGPSDGGGVLLRDSHRYPGSIWPILGYDHYFRDAPMDQFLGALLSNL